MKVKMTILFFMAKHFSKQLNCCAEKQLLCLQFQLVNSVGDTLV